MTSEEVREIGEIIAKSVRDVAVKQDIPDFAQGCVPVTLVANIYQRDASWVKAGIIAGWLPIGIATRKGKQITDLKEMDSKLGNINYYISPLKLWQDTGYVWRGEKRLAERD